jgi:uncharacterized membrane protein
MATSPRPGPSNGARWTDDEVDQLLGNLLRAGVIVATIVVLIGGTFYLARHGFEIMDRRAFQGEPSALRAIGGIIRGVAAGRAAAIVQLGLVLLIATPVARVAMSLIAFLLQRDRVYVFVTAIVLALLIFSLTGGVPG